LTTWPMRSSVPTETISAIICVLLPYFASVCWKLL